MVKNKTIGLVFLFVILLGLFLRIYPFEAKSWISDYDTLVVGEALDLGQALTTFDLTLWQDKIEYPYLIPYLLLFFYGIVFLIGLLINTFNSVSDFIPFLFANAIQVYWYSRMLIGLFGVATAFLVYLTVNQLIKKQGHWYGLLASALTAISLLLVQFSQQVRPHIVVSFFILLAYYFYLRSIERKTTASRYALASSVGLAIGAFFTGAFAGIYILLANFFNKFDFDITLRNIGQSLISKKLWLSLLLVGILVFVFYPFVFLGGEADRFVVADDETQGVVLSVGNNPFAVNSLGHGFKTLFDILTVHDFALGWLLGFFALLYFVYRQKQAGSDLYKKQLIGWWAFVAPYTLIYGLLDDGTRYRLICPLIAFLAIGLALMIRAVYDQLRFKKVVVVFIIILLISQLFITYKMVSLINQDYTRDLASVWLKNNVRSSQVILAQEPIPTLAPSKLSLAFKEQLRGSLSTREEYLRDLESDLYPPGAMSIIDISDISNYKKQNSDEINILINEIKPDYVVLMSRSLAEDKGRGCLICELAQKQGRLVKRFSPYKDQNEVRSLNFPSGFNNPLLDLAEAERFGPFVEIYQMDYEP